MNINNLGRKIKIERKKLGLTQAQFAELVDLSTSYYSQIERGERTPKLETFIRICKELNVNAIRFFYDVFESNEDTLKKNFLTEKLNHLTKEEYDLIFELVNNVADNLIKVRKSYSKLDEEIYKS